MALVEAAVVGETTHELTPGARHFLAQREAQGIIDVTDEQAEVLARLFAPRPPLKAGS